MAALDVIDWTRGSHKLNTQTREISVVTTPDCKWIDVGFADIEISKWATDYNKHHNWDLRVLGDSALSIPVLTEACRKRIDGNKSLTAKIAERKKSIGDRHARQWQKWQDQVKEQWNERPMTEARLAYEAWQVIKDEDWVLTANTLKEWTHKIWDFDKPYRHVGRELGTGTQIGMSIGVALAHKGTGKLVIDLQPDGDLMFDLGALWMPVKYDIPLLVLMYNNRVVPHQANRRILDGTAKRLGIKEDKVVITLERHGNTSAASIPLALAEAVSDGRIKRGDLVLMEAMGGGFTWGAVLVRW